MKDIGASSQVDSRRKEYIFPPMPTYSIFAGETQSKIPLCKLQQPRLQQNRFSSAPLFKVWRIQVHRVKQILENMNIYCHLCPQTLSLQVKCGQISSSYASYNIFSSATRHYSRVAVANEVILDLVLLFHYRLMQQTSYIICFYFTMVVTMHCNRAAWRS